MTWTRKDIPDQSGRVAVVTGANSGIGFETARALCLAGGHVVLACRDAERGQAAKARIEAEGPRGTAELVLLDLADLASIQDFAAAIASGHTRLDVLVNNAGVMIPPCGTTKDGFELQIGVNFLGHFALTGRLLPSLTAAPAARVVTLSSLAYRTGKIDIDGFRGPARYNAWREYCQSKLACLMFALELARRLTAEGSRVQSLAAHPGATQSELQRHSSVMDLGARVIGMPASEGALPSLFAATSLQARNGQYIGPGGPFELRGPPSLARISRRARDAAMAQRLWRAAEALTSVRYSS